MADVEAFRGITYAPERVALGDAIVPPYDVIDAAARAALAVAPHSFVHLDLPVADEVGADPYDRAATTLAAWRATGVLVQAARPTMYRYAQTFAHPQTPGRHVTRHGVIVAARLSPYREREVRPHERTLTAPKADRLALMRATAAQLSPVFAAFRDPAGEVERALRGVERAAPTLETTDADGVTHRLWACADAEVHGRVRRALAPHPLYILDGHHRYETMLAYRDELEAAAPLERHAAANFGLMCLVAADDPGLIVRPTYRLVHGVADLGIDRLRAVLAAEFDVEEVADGRAGLAALEGRLHAAGGGPALIAVAADAPVGLLATPRTRHGDVVADLPVSRLHAQVLDVGLGIDLAAQAAQRNITYVKQLAAVSAALDAGAAQAAFVVEPCAIAEVMATADAGHVLPQKSTFFVPKLASGLVLADVGRDVTLR